MPGAPPLTLTYRTYVPLPQEIRDYADFRNMHAVQINAQRFFGPHKSVPISFEPPDGSEIFIGRLPRDLFEPELVPFLELAGPFFQLRMLMDFSGTNRGYCFVKYYHPNQARFAAQLLNWREIRPTWPLRVNKSVDNRKLLLGGMPTYKAKNEIQYELSKFSGGILYISKRWVDHQRGPKGAVVVTYESHRAAALARSKILSCGLVLWGFKISVDWAEPKKKVSPQNSLKPEKTAVLRVRNLSRMTHARSLEKLFNMESCGGVKAVRKFRNRAFIEFRSRRHAETARAALDNYEIDGRTVTVDWNDPTINPPSTIFFKRIK